MILSHKHKFIFLKGRKVGSTSIETALSDICGEEDIITPITLIDEKVRIQRGGVPCQNYSLDKKGEEVYIDNILKGLKPKQPKSLFYNHMPLKEVLAKAKKDIKGYKVLFIERNPYSKIISWANMQLKFDSYQKGDEMLSGEDEVRDFIHNSFEYGGFKSVYNLPIYEGCELFKYYFIRYEDIEKEFYDFCMNEIGVRVPPLLPHLKKGVMSDQKDPVDFFSKNEIEIVNDFYKKEFDKFSYNMI